MYDIEEVSNNPVRSLVEINKTNKSCHILLNSYTYNGGDCIDMINTCSGFSKSPVHHFLIALQHMMMVQLKVGQQTFQGKMRHSGNQLTR